MDILLKLGTETMNVNIPEPRFGTLLKDIRAVLTDMRNHPDPLDAGSKVCIRLYHSHPGLHVGLRRFEDNAMYIEVDLRGGIIEFLYLALPKDTWEFEQFSQLSDQDLKRLAAKCLAGSN